MIDMTKFDFGPEQIRSVSELVFDEVVRGQNLDTLHTLYPNIVTSKQIGFIGKGGLVGVANQGCSPDAQTWQAGTRVVEFDPKDWEIRLSACWKDLEASAAVYSLHSGVDVADFTDTDYMAILTEVLLNSMNEFMYRLLWFSDVDAANVSAAGEITNGFDVKYFNILDGFFKQMDSQIALNPKQHIAISENAGATYDAQEVTAANAMTYIKSAYRAAPAQLRSMKNKMYLVTGGIYDAYAENFESTCCLETTYTNLVNGMTTLAYKGIPVVEMSIWDEIITSYFDDTATGRFIKPNRLVLTAPEVLAIGVDDPNGFDNVNSWYDKKDRTVLVEAMGKADAKLANPAMFVYGV